MFGKSELFRILALSALVLAVNLYGLDALEFFRHTEADRTLISWEMAESGDFLLPRLTHSVILTKPPLYYWILASWITVYGSAEEWVVRLPSVVAALLLVLSTYYFARRSGFGAELAFLAALILATSGQFISVANAAEIDMTFGLFSGVALFALFLGVANSSLIFFALAYLGLGLALMTKGLPILFFFFAVQFLFVAHRWFYLALNRRRDLFFLISANLIGAMLLGLLVAPWLYGLEQTVGLDEFWAQTKIEVFERIVQDVHYKRGLFYYFGVLAAGFAPWFLGLVLALVAWGKRFGLQQLSGRDYASRYDLFVTFCLVVVGVIFGSLSLAEGKSARYIFPLIPFLSCLTAASFAFIWRGENRGRIFRGLTFLGVLIFAAIPTGAFALYSQLGVSWLVLLYLSTLLLVVGLLFFVGGRRRDLVAVLAGMAVLAFSVRVGETEVFIPYRNNELSVKWVAEIVNSELPPGARIYNLELFDRWLTYYLKRMGRESYRLESANLPDLSAVNGRSYVLISGNEEQWRVEEIRAVDPNSRIVHDFSETRDKFILLELDSEKLGQLRYTKMFPTYPSRPFFEPG